MSKIKQITGFTVLSLLFSISPVSQANASESKEIIAKKLFIKTEIVSRLENEEQKKHIKNLYQNIFPELQTLKIFGIFPGPFITKKELKLSPEKLADFIADNKFGGWPWLIQFSINNCLDIFKTNQEYLIPFVKADINSEITANKKRALYVIQNLNLTNFFESIVYVLETDSSLFGIASITLRDIDNPKAIAPIVRTCPDLKRNMVFGYLRRLQRGRPADSSLITLLESKNPEVRWRAGYALAESNDPKLIPYVFRLSKDKNAMVRKQASNIGLCIKGKNFEKVRPALITLLHDPSTKVKLFTAICLAQRKDTACASTLLELLKDDSLDHPNHSNVVHAMQDLTGTYFGYHFGSDAWKPTTENNRRAIKQFAKWIKNNVDTD